MKNLYKSFIAILAVAAAASSCQKTGEPLGKAISVEPASIEVAGTASDPKDTVVTAEVTVNADGDWIAVVAECDWLSVSPNHGTGTAKVTVSARNNVDPVYKELAGPRSAKISFCVAQETVELEVNQKGEKGLDATRTYSRISKDEDLESGKGYIIAGINAGSFYNCVPVPAGKAYGWPAIAEIEVVDDVITLPNAGKAYTLTKVEGQDNQFYIQQPDGRYWYQTGSYTSFNVTDDPVSTEGSVFTISFDPDGNAVITNVAVAKFLQCSLVSAGASYDEFLSDAAMGDGCVPVVLFKDSKSASDEVLIVDEAVNVKAEETTVSIPVQSNKTWKVRCHDEWVKNFTKSGEGDGTIEVSFDKNTSYDDDQVAHLLVLGETTSIDVVLTHSKFIPALSVSTEVLSVASDATSASFAITSNVAWEINALEGVTFDPQSGAGDATIAMSFDANKTAEEITKTIVVNAKDDKMEVKEYPITFVQKSAAEKELPYSETFAESSGDFTINDVKLPEGSTYVWSHDAGYACMKASAYVNKTRLASESWLTSPVINLSDVTSAAVYFTICAANGVEGAYDDACYAVVTDIETGVDTALPLGFGTDYPAKYKWLDNVVNLSGFAGRKIKFAFVYKSTTSNCPTVEVKNVLFDIKYDSIGTINAMGPGFYNVKDATVYAFGNNNIIFGDGTGFILGYAKNTGLTPGDVVTINSDVKDYYGLLEFTKVNVDPVFTVTGHDDDIDCGTPEELDASAIAAYAGADVKVVKYIHASGIKSGYNVTVDGTDTVIALQGGNAEDGAVELYGFTAGYNGSSSPKKVTVVICSIANK